MTEKRKVIFILGYGHSGSTLLDVILGSHDDIASAGELDHFNPLPDIGNTPCSCGLPLSQCSYWQDVAEYFRKRVLSAKTTTLPRLSKKYDTRRSIGCWMRLVRQPTTPSSEYRLYCRCLITLFDGIYQASGRSVIVDSSKSPCRAATLAGLGAFIDLRAIHLVRDGRAVCWSMMKKRQRACGQTLSGGQQLIAFLRTMLGWMATNIQAELVGRKILGRDRYLRIRYEDLFEDHNHFFTCIGALTDETMDKPLAAIQSGTELTIGHMAGGNRLRLTNTVRLNPDCEWREKLPGIYKFVFRMLGGWALKRYGFPPH